MRAGQSLATIARKYKVRATDLAAANGLKRNSPLQPGQVLRIPESGVTYVRSGQTLSHVARAHNTSVEELMKLNRLREDEALRVGQRIILPGYLPSKERRRAERRWGTPRSPGIATLYRVATREKLRIRLVDARGRGRNAARKRLSELLRHRRTDKTRLPHRRLVELVARVSDHFGGRQVNILSGFRPAGGYTRETSRHTRGHAVDIRVSGVPNTTLRDYCQTFSKVGVGYYPRSTFVHLDVRDKSATWTDSSRPGEAPRYQKKRRGRSTREDRAEQAQPSVDDQSSSEVDETPRSDEEEIRQMESEAT